MHSIELVWYGMVEVCEGAPVAVSGRVLTDRHDLRCMCSSSASDRRKFMQVNRYICVTIF